MVYTSERVTLKLKPSVRGKKENSRYKNSLNILLLFPSCFYIIGAGFSSPGGKWDFLLSGDGVAGGPAQGSIFDIFRIEAFGVSSRKMFASCYELNCALHPQPCHSCSEVLNPLTSEYDLIWN